MRCQATSLWFGKSPLCLIGVKGKGPRQPHRPPLPLQGTLLWVKGCGDRRGPTGQLSLGAGAAAALILTAEK